MQQKVALSEISSDWIKRLFLTLNTWNWINSTINCFPSQTEPHWANLTYSGVFKRFFWNCQKNSLLVQKMKRTLFLKRMWNWYNPVENIFDLQNQPHWAVDSYSGFLYCFVSKAPKTTAMGQKLAISKLSQICCKQPLFFKHVKWENTNENNVSSQIVPHTIVSSQVF